MRTMAWVLVVEDEPEIAELIRVYLTKADLAVHWAASAEGALQWLGQGNEPQLILLDLQLPGMDGFEFLRQIRSRSPVPVIIVSSRESDEDKLAGLGWGADDFLTKPFSPRFLTAKVQALLRRVEAVAKTPPVVFGPYVLEEETARLLRDGVAVDLRRKEWDLLVFLLRHPGKPFAPDKLYKEVWGQEFGDLSTVAVHMQRLRKKLGEPMSAPRYLKTVPGFGYMFSPEGGG